MTIYRKVKVSERLPESRGYYDTDMGTLYYRKKIKHSIWEDWEDANYPKYPEYWLEEIELPTEEDINSIVSVYHDVENRNACRTGINYILNKIRGNETLSKSKR